MSRRNRQEAEDANEAQAAETPAQSISEQAAATGDAPTREKIETVNEETGEVLMVTPVSKLTVKEMEGNLASHVEKMELGELLVVGRMYGVARSYTAKESRFSTSSLPKEEYLFRGNFEGLNLITGDYYKSAGGRKGDVGKLYLPAPVDEMLAEALDLEDGGGVNFIVEISIRKIKKPDGTFGYKYVPRMPTSPKTSDPMREMRNKMKSLPSRYTPTEARQLEAPKPAETETV